MTPPTMYGSAKPPAMPLACKPATGMPTAPASSAAVAAPLPNIFTKSRHGARLLPRSQQIRVVHHPLDMPNSPLPQLSVIMIFPDGYESRRLAIRHLTAQTARAQIEL